VDHIGFTRPERKVRQKSVTRIRHKMC